MSINLHSKSSLKAEVLQHQANQDLCLREALDNQPSLRKAYGLPPYYLQCADSCSRLGDNWNQISCQTMLQEQLDAVKVQLLSDDNAEIREKIYNAYLEEPERGANMIITFARDKGLKLDVTAGEVVNHLEKVDADVDIELTPEKLASISGGVTTFAAASAANTLFNNNAHQHATKRQFWHGIGAYG